MEQAFLTAISDHQGILYKVCRLYRDTREDREDLFQEIVAQLWKAYPAYRQEAKLSTWIYRIALNTALTRYRRHTADIRFTDSLPEEAQAEEQESPQLERLFRAIRTLNDADKALISLYLDDFTYEEMAGVTGLSVNVIGVRLNRIREKLKQLLQ
ncbi:RNA polymerase sigma factor [Siphonobacter aquaeclarae]|uniref:RNA polymerase sigma-70 factor, ECF subfamily n=1 Tax=Siphonobacter aquaeclarae TaxID=563176 RepID=A0A1G9YA24_9BACT|nr:sigma-70 family RNA polymerase sigma factor [Siphonobacter aquaeclarae]SDN05974.1 RNA polymerase sigma-70 factor, ECF subfamily [Siphonobacter aquaeclarae]